MTMCSFAGLQPGEPKIFPNVPEWNRRLWQVKTHIDLKPITFELDKEPDYDDIPYMSIDADGRCVAFCARFLCKPDSTESRLQIRKALTTLDGIKLRRKSWRKLVNFARCFSTALSTLAHSAASAIRADDSASYRRAVNDALKSPGSLSVHNARRRSRQKWCVCVRESA